MSTPNVTGVDPTQWQQSRDASQQRRAERGQGDGWKPKMGSGGRAERNIIRIMPPHAAMQGRWSLYRRVHFKMGPSKDQAFECLGPGCPGEDYIEQLMAAAARETDAVRAAQYRQMARDAKAVDWHTINMVDMTHQEKGVQQWSMSDGPHSRLMAAFEDDYGKWRDITDPNTGRDVIVDVALKPGRWGGREMPEYQLVKAAENATPITNPAWLLQVMDLNQKSRPLSPAECVAIIQGRSAPPLHAALVQPAQPVAAQLVQPASPPSTGTPPPGYAPTFTAPAGLVPNVSASTSAPAVVVPQQISAVIPPEAPPASSSPRKGRRAMGQAEPPASAPAGDPWGQARAMLARTHPEITILDITPEDLALARSTTNGIPPCFEDDQDMADATCQACKCMVPCLAGMLLQGKTPK